MEYLNPDRIVTTHYEQYLDEPDEWLGVTAVAQIVQMTRENLPEVDLVIITFGEEDAQNE